MSNRARYARPDGWDRAEALVESRAIKILLAGLIVISVLPYPAIETTLRPLFLGAFGLEVALRVALVMKRPARRVRSEYVFLVIDVLAWVSFLPIEAVLGGGQRTLLVMLRLSRLLVLLRFSRDLALDVYRILTRREQLQQFYLVTGAVIAFSFVSAVLLMQLGIPHDYDERAETGAGSESFWERIWWSFRQIESPDNLVQNLEPHWLVTVLSLGLTIVGVFIIAYLIGVGANIVDQVVRAERRRPVGYSGHAVVVGEVHEADLLVREFVRIYEKNRALRTIRWREFWAWFAHGAPVPRRHALPRMALLGSSPEPPAYLLESPMRWVVYREGDPAKGEALDRVGIFAAKRAVVLASRTAGIDADAISVASLAAIREMNQHAHIFVEVADSANEDLVKTVGGEGTFPLDVPRFLGLFVCHHLIVPGIDIVLGELLSASGNEFYTHLFVDPAEHAGLARLGAEAVPFARLAEVAYREHGVILVGVFLGDEPVRRRVGGLVPVDRLTPWLNPETATDDEDLGAFRLERGLVPLERLRGLIGICSTYLPIRELGFRLARRGYDRLREPDALVGDDGPAEALAQAIRVDPRPVRSVLVIGYSPALGSLVRGLARFVPEVRITVVLSARQDARSTIEARLESLGLDLSEVPGDRGTTIALERGAEVTLYTHEGPDLVAFATGLGIASRQAGNGPIDATVFLSDPESIDRDARTALRVLRFGRAIVRGDIVHRENMHVLVELTEAERGERLRAQLATLGGLSERLRFTLLSTEQIRNYFMVHSAFVPGVTDIYSRLLAARGQELVRLDVGQDARSGEFDFWALSERLFARGCIPFALELHSGEVLVCPSPETMFEASSVRGVFAVADSDRIPVTFPNTKR